MPAEEKEPTSTETTTGNEKAESATTTTSASDPMANKDQSDKILQIKELYSQGSRNFLVKNYFEAADELSQVCALYEELYGELSAELGMPYLLYAKSLIALALEENKVIDVPNDAEEEDDDDEEDDGEEENGTAEDAASSTSKANGVGNIQKGNVEKPDNDAEKEIKNGSSAPAKEAKEEVPSSSSNDDAEKPNGSHSAKSTTVIDGEKPSTSNGDVDCTDADVQEDEENEGANNLQLAWEILELAAKIFSKQGLSGLPNLAEVHTELGNIEFENNIMDSAREDYEKALKIYMDLPKSYNRAMAEIHYKIGLTYLMQQLNKEGASSLKAACDLIDGEISEIKSKDELTEKDKNTIQDLEETKQEICAKIVEIEETQAQNMAEVRAALDSYIKPIVSQNAEDAGTSSSASANAANSAKSPGTSSSKATDISHLIKRKKPEEPSAEMEESPAKRPAV